MKGSGVNHYPRAPALYRWFDGKQYKIKEKLNNCDIYNIVLNSVHEHVTVASLGIIYVNLLDFIIYLDTASIIFKL